MDAVRRTALVVCAAAILVSAATTSAQEFRVFTKVYDTASPEGPTVPVSTSTTMFHAGRVYDYVSPAGELVVLDLANRKVTLFDTKRRVSTTVDFDEIVHLLKRSREETLEYLDELELEPGGKESTALLRFHLDPTFEESYDAEKQRLTLSSDHLVYRATCTELDEPEHLDAYLRYADWAARLNHVVHPHSPFPAARLRLDDALRERGRLPVQVELERRAAGEAPRTLKAVHLIHWNLNPTDRRKIHYWSTLLRDEKSTRNVGFREYQEAVLTATSR